MTTYITIFARVASLLVSSVILFAQKPIIEMTLSVVDDFGIPIGNLLIEAKTFASWTPGRDFGTDSYDSITLKSDKNGLCHLVMPSIRGEVKFEVVAGQGVHVSRWGKKFEKVDGLRWLPRDTNTTVVVKPIINPVAMFVMQTDTDGRSIKTLPKGVDAADYDFFKGDWIALHGKGDRGDVRVRVYQVVPITDRRRPFDTRLELTFLGENDGIVVAKSTEAEFDQMPLPRFAPEVGFERNFQGREFRNATGPIQREPPLDERRRNGYFFRIRTRTEPDGRFSGGFYGKILGSIGFGIAGDLEANISMCYFLNPSESDRNMENDWTTNLFRGRDGAGNQLR